MARVFELEEVSIVATTSGVLPSGWWVTEHAHPYWEFVYYLHGTGRTRFPHTSYNTRQHHISICPPQMGHTEITNPNDPQSYICLKIDVSGVPSFGIPLLLPDTFDRIRNFCEWIHQEFQTSGNTPLLHHYVHCFLLLIEQGWEKQMSFDVDSIELTMQYMQANYSQDITVSSLAALVNLSETHLRHKFTSRIGISPMRYLNLVRVRVAILLLTTSSFSISEIATRVGLSDPAYFTRVFKKITHLSPTDYRRRAKYAEKSKSSAALSIFDSIQS